MGNREKSWWEGFLLGIATHAGMKQTVTRIAHATVYAYAPPRAPKRFEISFVLDDGEPNAALWYGRTASAMKAEFERFRSEVP